MLVVELVHELRWHGALWNTESHWSRMPRGPWAGENLTSSLNIRLAQILMSKAQLEIMAALTLPPASSIPDSPPILLIVATHITSLRACPFWSFIPIGLWSRGGFKQLTCASWKLPVGFQKPSFKSGWIRWNSHDLRQILYIQKVVLSPDFWLPSTVSSNPMGLSLPWRWHFGTFSRRFWRNIHHVSCLKHQHVQSDDSSWYQQFLLYTSQNSEMTQDFSQVQRK